MSKDPKVKTDSEILRNIESEYYADLNEEGYENRLKRIRAISNKYSKEDISKARKALIDKYISEFEAQYFVLNPKEENDRLVKRLLQSLPKKVVDILNENKNKEITLKMRDSYTKDGAEAINEKLDESILLENTRKKIEDFKEGIRITLTIQSGPDDSDRKTYLKHQLEALEEVPRYKKELPRITEAEFSGMENGDIIKASWTYRGPDQNESIEDKYSDMHLVNWGGRTYLFCKKQDEEYECKEVKNVEEVATAVQSVGPDKQGNEYLNTPNKIKTGRLIKVGETRKVTVADPNLVDQKLKNLLVKLEGDKDTIDDSDKILLLMISEVFIANNGMSESFQRPLSLEETTDFLRFLTRGINSVENQTFAARIILCDQEKLNKIKTAFGTKDSFAFEFFQGSQHVQYTKDNFITSGPDTKFSEVLAKEGESEKEAAKKTREDGNAKREALKQEILSGNKACLYNSGAHHIGLVFGGAKDEKRQIYIQDSTENIADDITSNYERAIKQFYTGEYDIVKTVQKKDTKSMFASQETGPGIENQCRYSAIIFSERVLAEVRGGGSPGEFSIKYGQADFESKFVEWFDKSQLGQEISGQKKSPTPESSSANVAKTIELKLEDFPQSNAAGEFCKLDETEQKKILERTRITVTEEEIEHAKRFIALVAITGGETGRESDENEISQKKVYENQGILPKDCLKDLETISFSKEPIDSVAARITPENIRAFYKRLIEKRPKAFYSADDSGFLRRGDLPYKFKKGFNWKEDVNPPEGDLNLPEYVGYSEIEFGAMLQVFGATQFINDGNRDNAGEIWQEGKPGSHEKAGYISAIAGMRLETTTEPSMERIHVIGGERDKAFTEYEKSKELGKSEFARMKGVNDDFVAGHKLIWDEFYSKSSQATAIGIFNEKAAEHRLCISYKKFLAESIANAEKDGKKAHIRITGCGDGVWAGNEETKTKVKSAIGKAVRMAFDDLHEERKSQISAIEFCEFKGENYYNGFIGVPSAEFTGKLTDEDEKKASYSVNIIKSDAKFSHELQAGEKKSDEKDTVLCVNFAWDGGSYVGNEYWNGYLIASGDPAAACCSSIAISMNPEINPQFLDKLFVVSKDGAVKEYGKSKSEFVALEYKADPTSQIGVNPYYDFIGTENEDLKKVPVAITGSTLTGIFWKIGGGGMNRQLETYLGRHNGALNRANEKLAEAAKIFGGYEKEATGTITQVDLELIGNPQVQKILYSASPNLSGLDEAEAEEAMIAFGTKFRNQLSEQNIPELCLPLFSGGIYRGKNSQNKVAEWLMEGWFAAEAKNPKIEPVKVYLGHQCLENAVKKMSKTTTPLASPAPAKAGAGKAGSKAKIAQLTREQILGDLYSDHLLQVFNIKLKGPEKVGEVSANESNVKILSWNVLGQCTKESKTGSKLFDKPANNPWNYSESEKEFKTRRAKQNVDIAAHVKRVEIDIICLQEYTANDNEASTKLCEELKTELGGGWDYKFSEEVGNKKSNVTFYNGAKLQVVGEAALGLNTNDALKFPFNCATELKFKSKASNQEFIVSNVHVAYGKKAKVEEYLSKKRDLPFFAVGDFNEDAKSFTGTHKPVAPNGATNFDAPDRRDDAEMVVANKCYDIAFAVLPTGFEAEVKCFGNVFNEGLQPIADSERSSSFGAPTPTKTVVKVKQSKPSIVRVPTINPKDWPKKYGHIPREKNGLTDSLAKTLVENITTTKQAKMVLRAVQASVQRLEDEKSEDAATLLLIDFKNAGVSSAVQEIFFEVDNDSEKTSFKKESFKDRESNADALTNVSHLVARHLELVDPHKNLAKKLIKYQLQEIGKIKEGDTVKEKEKNSADKAYKIKTLRNLAVYLGASGESEKLVIGDRHEDSSEFVNLLLDALYETPPFRLEKTSSAVENGGICSVKNNPANTLQTELPKATIRDSGEEEFEATTFGKTIAAYQEAEILGKDLSEKVYRAELNRRFDRLRAGNKLNEFNVFDNYYKSEVERGGLGEYLTSAYVAFDTTEGKKKFKTKSQFKVFVRNDVSEIVVSTKRFAFTEEGEGHKLRNEVTLDPITLPIDGATKGETKIFEPTSIIQHIGGLDGGHYISYIKERDNEWYCYNDEKRSGPIKEGDLAQAQKDSYIVKYSVVGASLPEAQAGARNLTCNMCWANAAAALTASCSSLLGEEIVLTTEEKSILDGDLVREFGDLKQVSRDLLWLSSDIKTVINQETFSDHGLSEDEDGCDFESPTEEIDISRSEQEYFLRNIKDPKAYYDFQTLNFAINAAVGSTRNIELVEYDAQPTHEENLNRGINRLFDESSNLRGLAIPMRPVSDLDGTSKARGHFTGLYVAKKEESSFGAFYIDPTGEGRVTDIPKYIMDKLEVLCIDRDNIELTTNKIQHCTESSVDEIVIDGVKLSLKTDGRPTNLHCGAFIADILSGLITGEKSIQYGRIKSKTESGEGVVWQDLPDLDQTKSDEEGKRIRRVHQALLEGAPEIVIDESLVPRSPKGGFGGLGSSSDSDSEFDEESLSESEEELSEEIEIEGMKVSKDKKTITLSFKGSKGDKAAPITINAKGNKFLEVGDTSSGEPQVEIKNEDFRKELMKYYLSGRGKNAPAKAKYKAPEEKMDVVGKDALEVLNIYRAVPSTSIAARSASKVIVGDLIKGR